MASPASVAVPAVRAHARPARTRLDVAVVAVEVAIVVAAEVAFLQLGLALGGIAALIAIAALLAISALGREHLRGRVAIGLAVLPLLRLLSIGIPSLIVPPWLWYAEIGVPVLVGTVLAASVAGIGPTQLGLRPASPIVISTAATAGLVAGLFAYLMTLPEIAPSDRSPLTFLGAAVSIMVGGTVAEELLFRGLLQQLGDELVDGYGMLFSAALCTLMYAATANVRYTLLMAGVALALGLTTRRYRSIVPAIACHGLLLWSQLILWPALWPVLFG